MPALTSIQEIPQRLRARPEAPVPVAAVGAEEHLISALVRAQHEGLLSPVMAEGRAR